MQMQILMVQPVVLTDHIIGVNFENNSDENTLIIHDATITNIYLQEFEKRWGELTWEQMFLLIIIFEI